MKLKELIADLEHIDILIFSYLGSNEELQELRHANHVKQLQSLEKHFAGFNVVTLASGWPKWARQSIAAMKWDHRFIKKRTYKHRKQRAVFELLKGLPDPQVILLLDDDTQLSPSAEGSLPQAAKLIRNWIKKPKTMPSPVMWFSMEAKFTDMYTKNREKTPHSAPMSVAGGAMLVRNDFYVKIKDSNYIRDGVLLSEDAILRATCAAKGIDALKHRGIFFRQAESWGKEKLSTWAMEGQCSKEIRKALIEKTTDQVLEKWPWLFRPTKRRNRLDPIWSVRGREMKRMIAAGAIRKTEYGLVPVPSVLKDYLEQKSEGRTSLVDLLE